MASSMAWKPSHLQSALDFVRSAKQNLREIDLWIFRIVLDGYIERRYTKPEVCEYIWESHLKEQVNNFLNSIDKLDAQDYPIILAEVYPELHYVNRRSSRGVRNSSVLAQSNVGSVPTLTQQDQIQSLAGQIQLQMQPQMEKIQLKQMQLQLQQIQLELNQPEQEQQRQQPNKLEQLIQQSALDFVRSAKQNLREIDLWIFRIVLDGYIERRYTKPDVCEYIWESHFKEQVNSFLNSIDKLDAHDYPIILTEVYPELHYVNKRSSCGVRNSSVLAQSNVGSVPTLQLTQQDQIQSLAGQIQLQMEPQMEKILLEQMQLQLRQIQQELNQPQQEQQQQQQQPNQLEQLIQQHVQVHKQMQKVLHLIQQEQMEAILQQHQQEMVALEQKIQELVDHLQNSFELEQQRILQKLPELKMIQKTNRDQQNQLLDQMEPLQLILQQKRKMITKQWEVLNDILLLPLVVDTIKKISCDYCANRIGEQELTNSLNKLLPFAVEMVPIVLGIISDSAVIFGNEG